MGLGTVINVVTVIVGALVGMAWDTASRSELGALSQIAWAWSPS